MITRRMFLGHVCTALAAAGCSPSRDGKNQNGSEQPTVASDARNATGPRLKLTAVNTPGLCLVASRVALANGFFAAEGLDVELLNADVSRDHDHVGTWVTDPTGPVRGDIITVEYPFLVDMTSGKLDYYVVAGEHSGCRQLIVPEKASTRSLADLKGKRVGLPQGNDRVMWEYLIRQAGVPTESVEWVPVALPAGPGGLDEVEFVRREFAAGRLDAHVAVDPAGEILKSEGVARLLVSNTWTAPLKDWYCCMIAVRRAVIDAHPEAASAITRAYRRSTAFVEQNPAEAVRLSVEGGYMPRDTQQDLNVRLLKEYVWTATGRIEDDLERYFHLLIEAGQLPASASPGELVKRVYRSGE